MKQELLEQKVKEFEHEFKKTPTEYGFPIVAVVDEDVVFCRNRQILENYKKEVNSSTKRLLIAIMSVVLSLACGTIGILLNCSNLVIVLGLWVVFFLGCYGNWYLSHQTTKSKIKYGDIIIFEGPNKNS